MGARLCGKERPLPRPQAAVFLFCVGGRSVKKEAKASSNTLAPGPRIAKGWGLLLYAIHKANVAVALLFQTLIKMKKGRPVMHVHGRPLEPTGVLSGGVWGVRRFMETNSVGSSWFQKWKKRF